MSKILFKSVQVSACYCKMFWGLTFLWTQHRQGNFGKCFVQLPYLYEISTTANYMFKFVTHGSVILFMKTNYVMKGTLWVSFTNEKVPNKPTNKQ